MKIPEFVKKASEKRRRTNNRRYNVDHVIQDPHIHYKSVQGRRETRRQDKGASVLQGIRLQGAVLRRKDYSKRLGTADIQPATKRGPYGRTSFYDENGRRCRDIAQTFLQLSTEKYNWGATFMAGLFQLGHPKCNQKFEKFQEFFALICGFLVDAGLNTRHVTVNVFKKCKFTGRIRWKNNLIYTNARDISSFCNTVLKQTEKAKDLWDLATNFE